MMRKSIAALAALLVLLPIGTPAAASSEQAWKEFYARVTRSCVAASGIRNPLSSTIIDFEGRDDVVAMLVSDRTRGSMRAKLCLYTKRTQRVSVGDAQMWSAPPQRR